MRYRALQHANGYFMSEIMISARLKAIQVRTDEPYVEEDWSDE